MKRAYKIFFEIVFFLILALGITATAIHFFVQELDLFRHQVVKYIEDHTGSLVTIGTIKTEWHGLIPSFQLENINFKNADFSGTIKTLDLDVDLYRSLIHQRYQLGHLSVNGIEIQIIPTLAHLLNQHNTSSGLNTLLTHFLFHQLNNVDLHNININIVQSNGHHLTFNIPKFYWLNDGSKHQGEGLVDIVGAHQQYGALNLQLKLTSKAGKLENGVIYLAANSLNITPWLETDLSHKMKLTKGNISLQTWINIQNGEVSKITTSLPHAMLAWQDNQQQPHQLQMTQQTIYFTHNQQGWDLNLPKVQFTLDGQVFSDLPIELNWQGNHLHWYDFYQSNQLKLHFAALNLGEISPLVELFSPFYPRFYQYWQVLKPKGQVNKLDLSLNLHDLSLNLHDLSLSRFDVVWQDVSWSADNNIPGMSHLSGETSGALDHGKLILNTQQASLDYARYFPRRIPITQLQGVINWQNTESGLKITAENLNLQTPSLSLHGALAYYHLSHSQPWLSVAAGMSVTNAKQAQYYYPKHIMSSDVIKYLTNAIQGGVANNGTILFSGNPTEFPYHSAQQGIFQIYFPLQHAQFQFNPNWPALTNSNLVLNFLNDSLTVSANELNLDGITAKNLIANIPHYSEKRVLITADVAGKGSVISDYFNQTPLKTSLGEALQKVQISGEVNGNLKLNIPFDEQSLPIATGEITLPNNTITITPIATQLQQVKGHFSFINGEITAQDLQAEWGSQPITLNLKTDSHPKNYQINLGIQANWALDHLALPRLITQQLSGNAAWQMQVGITIPTDSGIPNYQVALNAKLSHLSSRLPAPLNFELKSNAAVTLEAKGVGEQFNVQGDIDNNSINSDWQVINKRLILNKLVWDAQQQTIPTLPKNALVKVNLPAVKVDLAAWLPYYSVLQHNKSEIDFQLPKQAIVNIENLILLKQQWNKLQLNYQAGQQPKLTFKGTDVDGSLTMPQDQPWDLNFSYLYFNPGGLSLSDVLHTSQSTPSTRPAIAIDSFAGYPSLNLDCQDCWLFGQRLDAVQANIVTTPQELSINNGVVDNKVGQLQFSLNWKLGKTQTTQLSAELSGNNLTDFNQYLNIPPSVSGAKFNFKSDLNWQGAPWEPQINTLNGSIGGKIGKGVIHSIQMGNAGKILNVLTLEPLIRQLQSDFRDVFDNGFYFSGISSYCTIKNGIMNLNKVDINGLAAYVTLLGQLDLNDNRLNVEAKVAPEISAGVGIATAFAVNPLAGVVAYVGSKLFSPIWRNIFLVHYAITGAITDPQIEQNKIKTRKTSH